MFSEAESLFYFPEKRNLSTSTKPIDNLELTKILLDFFIIEF